MTVSAVFILLSFLFCLLKISGLLASCESPFLSCICEPELAKSNGPVTQNLNMNGKILRKEKVDLRFPADRSVGGPGVCAQQQISFSVQETITKAMGLPSEAVWAVGRTKWFILSWATAASAVYGQATLKIIMYNMSRWEFMQTSMHTYMIGMKHSSHSSHCAT